MWTLSGQAARVQALGLFWQQPGARGDDEYVVAEDCPVVQQHRFPAQVDPFDRGPAEVDPGVQLPVARPGDLVQIGQAERDEQQTGLVDVLVVLIDDDDVGVARGQHPAQAIGQQRSAGPTTKDQDSPHTPRLRGRIRDS